MTDRTANLNGDDEGGRVHRAFWPKLRKVAASLPFAQDLLAAYYCAVDSKTPHHVRAALFGAIGYFVLPFDAIPDMLPLFGFTDDAAVLAGVFKLMVAHITPAHREAAAQAIQHGLNGDDAIG